MEKRFLDFVCFYFCYLINKVFKIQSFFAHLIYINLQGVSYDKKIIFINAMFFILYFIISCASPSHQLSSQKLNLKELESKIPTSPPSQELLKSVDYGPFPENYKELIHNYFYKIAIDPTSLIYRDWKIFKDWAIIMNRKNNDYFFDYIFGYSVCVYVNAKNRFGGYVGWELYWFFIRNNKLYMHSTSYTFINLGISKRFRILGDLVRICSGDTNIPPKEKEIMEIIE